MSSTKPLIQHFSGARDMPLINFRKGAWVFDMGTADVSDKQYTGGMFIKDEHGSDLSNDNFPVNEWKFILEGEWHLVQEGNTIIAKAGDVVFLPKGTAFKSLSHPFKAFFVTNRAGREYTPISEAN